MSGKQSWLVMMMSAVSFVACTELEGSEPAGEDIGVVQQDVVTQNRRILTIGCYYNDDAGPPASLSLGTTEHLLNRDTYPGVSHYFRSVSNNALSTTGSRAIGWFRLPLNQSGYMPGGVIDRDKLADDCTNKANAAGTVRFPDYDYLVITAIMPNSWGTVPRTYSYGGVTKSYGVVYLIPGGQFFLEGLAHELGHGFGFQHAISNFSDPAHPRCEYASMFDPMGNSAHNNCSDGICFPEYYSADNRARAGWVDAARIATVPGAGAVTTCPLDPADTRTGTTLLRVPLVTGGYYALENRRRGGVNFDGSASYDNDLPNDGVTITIAERPEWDTWLMDADANCDTTDAGAVYTPGEMFRDDYRGVMVRVRSQTGTQYSVEVTAPKKQTIVATHGSVLRRIAGSLDQTCSGTCSFGVLPATSMTLFATPNSGWAFDHWVNCPSSSWTTCSLTTAASMAPEPTVQAVFVQTCTPTLDDECMQSCMEDCTRPFSVCVPTCRSRCTRCP